MPTPGSASTRVERQTIPPRGWWQQRAHPRDSSRSDVPNPQWEHHQKVHPRSRVTAAAVTLAALLLATGTWHFVSPHGFESIVPGFVGSPAFWVALSGVGELACAVGLLIPRTRRVAGWCAAALFVVVFPANVEMAVQAWHGDGSKLVAYGRLPLQIPLVLWAVYIARGGFSRRTHTPVEASSRTS
jgi:uncharacterized membrane protein